MPSQITPTSARSEQGSDQTLNNITRNKRDQIMEVLAKRGCCHPSPKRLNESPQSCWSSPSSLSLDHCISVSFETNFDGEDDTPMYDTNEDYKNTTSSCGLTSTKLLMWKADEEESLDNAEMDIICHAVSCDKDTSPDVCTSSGRLDTVCKNEEEEEEFCPRFISQWSDVAHLVTEMQERQEEPTIQERYFEQLRSVAMSEGGRAVIGATGGIHEVIHAMNIHMNCPNLQSAACHALIELLNRDEKNVNSFVDANGVRTVLQSMQRHPQSVEIQERGMVLLSRLTTCQAHILALRSENPRRIIVDAANRFPMECQRAALKLLYKL